MKRAFPLTLALTLAISPIAVAESAYLADAESGDAQAQYELAEYYYTQERDFEKAAEWMEKSAAQGHDQAADELGFYYYTGQGVKADTGKAIEWWTVAAEAGNTEAMRRLGYLYETGDGVSKSEETAVTYYTAAADLGDPEAMYTLGYCYLNGTGVTADEQTSVDYFNQAAALGDPESQAYLGQYYLTKGDGSRAQIYYQAAAVQGNASAQYALGYMLYYGAGVEQDIEQARSWWDQAASNGSTDAIIGLFYIDHNDGTVPRLEPGVSGDEVTELQETLIAMGYMTGKTSGKYSKETENAVKLFQEAHGLEATGTCDAETQAYISFYKDKNINAVQIASVSLQNADVTPRLFVCFTNKGTKDISQITFEVLPLDANDKPMEAFNSYESISCTSVRPLAQGATDSKGYFWTLNGCAGVRGVKIAVSGVTYADGTSVTLPNGCLNWIAYTQH